MTAPRGAKVADEEPEPALGPVLDFMRLLWELDHALQRRSKRMETSLGLTGPQRFVIRILGRFPGISAGRLARLLHVHPSTLTGVVQRLERRGLVRRRADPRDGRRMLLSLTADGRAFDVQTAGTIEAAVQSALERTSGGTIAAARKMLDALTTELET